MFFRYIFQHFSTAKLYCLLSSAVILSDPAIGNPVFNSRPFLMFVSDTIICNHIYMSIHISAYFYHLYDCTCFSIYLSMFLYILHNMVLHSIMTYIKAHITTYIYIHMLLYVLKLICIVFLCFTYAFICSCISFKIKLFSCVLEWSVYAIRISFYLLDTSGNHCTCDPVICCRSDQSFTIWYMYGNRVTIRNIYDFTKTIW